MNHTKYLEKLKHKDIKVVPLEKYIKSKIKILHKCTCDNNWHITPNRVLQGQKCGCNLIQYNQTHSHNRYIDILKLKNIEIIPLEEYRGDKIKILHKCGCDNEWFVTPNSVKSGASCGCKKNYSLRGIEFYRNKETILYYIKITGLWKIGVALFNTSIEKTLKKRFGKEYYLIEEIIKTEVFEDGSKAFDMEQKILNYNWNKKYKGPKVLNSGNTELFNEKLI